MVATHPELLENYHSMASAWLHRQVKVELEDSGLLSGEEQDLIKEEVYKIAETVYEHEVEIVKMIFSEGGIRTVSEENILQFVRNRIDTVLGYLNYPPLYGEESGVVSEWFYNQLSSYKYADFFHAQQIQYVRDWKKHDLVFRSYMEETV